MVTGPSSSSPTSSSSILGLCFFFLFFLEEGGASSWASSPPAPVSAAATSVFCFDLDFFGSGGGGGAAASESGAFSSSSGASATAFEGLREPEGTCPRPMSAPSLLQKPRPTSAAIFLGFAPANEASPRSDPSRPSWTMIFARFRPTSPVTMTVSDSSLATFWNPSSDSSREPVFCIAVSISRDLARS